ncbi:MAG: hypothetical protein NTV34_16130 [Proteobacteria bacterium]|nr:hypothetical protein [Pseudomonadota bacterium]
MILTQIYSKFTNYFKLPKLVALGAAGLLTLSHCGKQDQKIQSKTPSPATPDPSSDGSKAVKEDSSGGEKLKDPACPSSKNCPAIEFTLADESGSAPAIKAASVGKAVSWTFLIKSKAIAGRLLIANKQQPIWATIKNGDKPGMKVLTGVPTEKIANGELIFLVRDIVRCQVTEKEPGVCSKADADLGYDKKLVVKYTVTASSKTGS